jgi:hypothetical protein
MSALPPARGFSTSRAPPVPWDKDARDLCDRRYRQWRKLKRAAEAAAVASGTPTRPGVERADGTLIVLVTARSLLESLSR